MVGHSRSKNGVFSYAYGGDPRLSALQLNDILCGFSSRRAGGRGAGFERKNFGANEMAVVRELVPGDTNAVLNHAERRVEQVLLAVASHNGRAIRFYERLGFKSYATEPRAMKVGQGYVDELLMVRFLTPSQ